MSSGAAARKLRSAEVAEGIVADKVQSAASLKTTAAPVGNLMKRSDQGWLVNNCELIKKILFCTLPSLSLFASYSSLLSFYSLSLVFL